MDRRGPAGRSRKQCVRCELEDLYVVVEDQIGFCPSIRQIDIARELGQRVAIRGKFGSEKREGGNSLSYEYRRRDSY
jgi:hypothetical protein